MLADVYWNLHKDTYSIRAVTGPNKGRVIRYADTVSLVDATMVVRENARQRVISNKCKEVHAWIRGRLVESIDSKGLEPITYNPYRDSTFVRRSDRSPIMNAKSVLCLITESRKPNVLAD